MSEVLQKETKDKYPKLPPIWKKKFLEALRGGCYRFTTGDWYRRLEKPRKNKKGVIHEYEHCVLGAAYHFSTGENQGPEGFRKHKVPKSFKDSKVRGIVMEMNDDSRSYKKVANWIEKNL